MGFNLKYICTFNPLYYTGCQWTIVELSGAYKTVEKAGELDLQG